MNVYESMNKAMDKELEKVPTAKKLTESVEEIKPVVEFKAIEIPAPFDTYYRTLQPEEYEDVVGCSYEDCAEDDAADYGVDAIQYIVAKDDQKASLSDVGMDILSVYKDGSTVGVGQEVGGRLFPVDFIDIKDYITECMKPVIEEMQPKNEDLSPLDKLKKAYPDLDLSSEQAADTPRKKANRIESNPLDKLKRAYPELNLTESAEADDKWDEIYSELTMDGAQVKKGHTTQFNKGVGYDYTDQICTGKNGEICVGAMTLEELKPAADVAIKHKGEGVTYKMRRGGDRDKWAYFIDICIPGIDMEECANKPLGEEIEIKNEELSPIEKLKKAYPELNLD